MRIDLVTLFPEMFAGVFGSSIIGRAAERGIVDIHYTNFRDYSTDKHRHVDDAPFGGGAGMVLKPEPLFRAVRDVQSKTSAYESGRCTIIFDPAGDVFTQDTAKEFAAHQQLILICGHYEGFDARIYDLVDRIVSVGDFVLTGGEIPAMLVVDATARMLAGKAVPDVLLSGDHAAIARWRREQALLMTLRHRPELLANAKLSQADRDYLAEQEKRR